jgi:seryl-tRNA synthetase
VLDVFEFFQAEFRSLARRYDAEEHRYPAMMPIEVLEEIGYFTHFPQHVTFCSHFPEDLAFLETVAEVAKGHDGRLPESTRERVRGPRHVLAPAVCLPCYPRMRDRVVDPDGSDRMSIENHVVRYEGSNCRSLARCWEFTVRDVVFFGSTAAVGRLRQELMEWAFALCQELDLDARVQLANDPFFLNEARNKRVYQRLGEVKYELVLSLPHRDEAIAAASFNLHRDFYSRIYNIRLPDQSAAESGCVGFGIERWVYAFLSQKGLDPCRWPERPARYVVRERGCTADAAGRPEELRP